MDDNGIYTVSTVRRRKRRMLPTPIKRPQDVYNLVKPLVADADQEHFYCLYLNTRNRLLAVELISVGSLNASIVHPREVFRPALMLAAGSLIVAHNHPSGETDPSEDDLAITRRLREVGEVLGITMLDHIIVANGSWTSLKEEGHL
jgi:DNA repair protein RadC